jgi:flagellar biosynthetic protein FlhB
MSDSPEKHEKIFDPTPRRLQEAKDEGQVCKSREVGTAAMVLAAAIGVVLTGQGFMETLIHGAREAFIRSPEAAHSLQPIVHVFTTYVGRLAWVMAPLIAIMLVVAVLSNIGQTGVIFSLKAVKPKWDNVNPFKKIKELFGPVQASMKVATAVLKIGFVGIVVSIIVADELQDIQLVSSRDVDRIASDLGGAAVRILLSAGLCLCVVGVIDFIYQKRRYIQKLKMTHEEIKRERKDNEGSPELKGRRMSMHRDLTLNKVLKEVPTADVVVTNPTHYAVALRYIQGVDAAPRVVAKGMDSLALTIRQIARRNNVPIVENRPLARVLWRTVKVGRGVPMDLFQAVAEVLAHVYRLRQRLLNRGVNR